MLRKTLEVTEGNLWSTGWEPVFLTVVYIKIQLNYQTTLTRMSSLLTFLVASEKISHTWSWRVELRIFRLLDIQFCQGKKQQEFYFHSTMLIHTLTKLISHLCLWLLQYIQFMKCAMGVPNPPVQVLSFRIWWWLKGRVVHSISLVVCSNRQGYLVSTSRSLAYTRRLCSALSTSWTPRSGWLPHN